MSRKEKLHLVDIAKRAFFAAIVGMNFSFSEMNDVAAASTSKQVISSVKSEEVNNVSYKTSLLKEYDSNGLSKIAIVTSTYLIPGTNPWDKLHSRAWHAFNKEMTELLQTGKYRVIGYGVGIGDCGGKKDNSGYSCGSMMYRVNIKVVHNDEKPHKHFAIRGTIIPVRGGKDSEKQIENALSKILNEKDHTGRSLRERLSNLGIVIKFVAPPVELNGYTFQSVLGVGTRR